MSVIGISLDTSSRQLALTIDGVIVPATDVYVEKFMDAFNDGKEIVNFSYTIKSINSQGLKERRQFYLPSPEELATEAHAGLDKNGLSSKPVHNDEKAKADTIDFIKRSRNRK
jgi:hypothetical protein